MATCWRTSATLARKSFTAFAIKGRVAASDQDTLTPISALTEGALAAAKSAGKEWEDVSEEKLYGPLGMTSTSSRFKDFVARENRALGHVEVDGKWVHKLQRDPDAQSPAGGVR